MKNHWLHGTVLLGLLVLCGQTTVQADKHALLIGIDVYQDRNRITPLNAASADAKGLAKALEEAAGFPHDNIRVLTSDGDPKPTGVNIRYELAQLRKRVKAGDLVFVAFSGHGIEMNGGSFMLPWDTDAREDETLEATLLPTSDVVKSLQKLPAKALIVAYDMCRSEPRQGGARAADLRYNLLGSRQARNMVVRAAAAGEGEGPQVSVTLFACSPRQCSYEWASRGRGYFSYFLEQGLRQEAADESGTVRIRNLKAYLEKAVPGAVLREEGREQTPYPEIVGPNADEVVLASGRPVGRGGESAVPIKIGDDVPSRYDAAIQRGFELIDKKRTDAAQDRFEEALMLKPNSGRAVHGLALIQQELLENLSAAEKLYLKAMALAPDYAPSVNNLANIYKSQKKDVEAEKLYQKAMTLDPNRSMICTNFGDFYRLRGKWDKAEPLFLRAIQLDPKDGLPVCELANLRSDQNRLVEAEILYKKALELDTQSGVVAYDTARFYEKQKKWQDAKRLIQQAIQSDPKKAGYITTLGRIVMEADQNFSEGERLFRRAMEVDPKDALPPALLAVFCMSYKMDCKEAETFIKQAIALSPNTSNYHTVYATILALTNRRDEAISAAKRALELGDEGTQPVFKTLGLKP